MPNTNFATTTLVGAVEMNSRFATIVSVETVACEKEFYDALLELAGKKISSSELVLRFTMAMVRRPLPTIINISSHLEAMVGTRENQVFKEAWRVFENIAKRSMENRTHDIAAGVEQMTLMRYGKKW
jgi:hypothetical protein